jgi:hypothetical protein
VLDLFARPSIDRRNEGGIVGEDTVEIYAVVAAITLHQSRSLDVAQDLRIDL